MHYVCPHCWNTLDECVCEQFPPYHLILIDKNIQEHIRILNNKGYSTMYCCEGHCAGSNTYISFGNVDFDDDTLPVGFKYSKKHHMLSYTYSTRLSNEEVEEIKKEKLKILLDWCKNLPVRNCY